MLRVSQISITRAKFRQSNPCLSMAQVGRHFGVSRERVRQDCNRLGIDTVRPGLKACICPECKGPKAHGSKLCENCYHEQHWVTLICYCGCEQTFSRIQSDFLRSIRKNQETFFKDRIHFGRWLGTNYGKGRSKGQKI